MPEHSGISTSAAPVSVGQRQADCVSGDTGSRAQTHQFVSRLEAYLITTYGDNGALIRAQMIFDACGPGRNIDPQTLFKEDSEGEAWRDAIENSNF